MAILVLPAIGIWILGILLSAVVGETYRNQAALGGLLGFLFGPLFGPLLVLGLSDWRPYCPACRTVVHEDATICPSCRSPISAKKKPAQPPK